MKALILLAIATLTCAQIITTNFGCRSLSSDGVTCLECSQRFFKDSQGICQPVSSSCKTYDNVTGACTSCYSGYLLIDVICFKNPKPQDPNCANLTNGVCQQCSRGFYLLNGTCELVDPLCKSFDYSKLVCSECYGGYQLVNSTCQVAPPSGTMPGCSKFNGSLCVECARDYYFDANGICVQVSSNCKQFNKTNGLCLSCFPGWKLQNLTCVVQPSGAIDPNCKKFQNNTCVECSRGFYFGSNKVCLQASPFCKTFDFVALTCAQCYSGFTLVNNSCVFDETKPAYDVNCKTFDNNGVCLNCSRGYYFDKNNVCIQVDPSCRTFDFQNTVCTDCYSGYTLKNGFCERDNATVVSQKNCAEEMFGVCVKCVARAYYDINNNCVMVSDLCKDFNTFSGHCTSCYTGYALETATGQCLPSDSANCNQTDPKTQACTQCVKGYFLDTSSKCRKVDSFCQTFNFTARVCQACYKGYILNAGKGCELAPVITAPAVQNCVSYDVTGVVCVQCFSRYYLVNNTCIQADPLCKTFDKNGGACLSCYTGFTLQNGKCVFQ